MNKHFFIVTAIAVIMVISSSCKKKDECVAGSGGEVTVVAFPQHHGKPIYNDEKPGIPDSAFIKFSPADNFVTTSNPADYDLIFVGEAGEDHVHLTNLKCGSYYIFMTGADTTLNGNQRVKGGIPFSFTQTSGEIDLDVPVTED